jgi:hypothetical protein
MVAFSFSEPRFVPLILSGEKDQTTRPLTTGRLKQLKNSKALQLYYQQRSKEGFKICDAEKTDLFIIKLQPECPYLVDDNCILPFPADKAETLAQRDGFECYREMFGWFLNKYGTVRTRDSLFIVTRWTVPRQIHDPEPIMPEINMADVIRPKGVASQ